MAGFCVGVVEREHIISGKSIQVGDLVLGLASSGLHSNGYSLARKVLPRQALRDRLHPGGPTLLDALLEPHRSYLEPVRRLRSSLTVKGLAHITGGGVLGNLPRILPRGLGAEIVRGTWPEPEVFSYLTPFVPDVELWRTFNMGLGMIAVVEAASVGSALRALDGEAFDVGRVVASGGKVLIRE